MVTCDTAYRYPVPYPGWDGSWCGAVVLTYKKKRLSNPRGEPFNYPASRLAGYSLSASPRVEEHGQGEMSAEAEASRARHRRRASLEALAQPRSGTSWRPVARRLSPASAAPTC